MNKFVKQIINENCLNKMKKINMIHTKSIKFVQ